MKSFTKKHSFLAIAIFAFTFLSSFSRGVADDFQRFSALPFAAYSEETKIQYGAMLILFFKPFEGGSQVSSIDFVAIGTQESQYQFRTKPEFYLLQDHLHIPSEFKISSWQGKYFERGTKGDFEAIANYDQLSLKGRLPIEMNFGIPQSIPFRYGVVFEGEYRDNDFKEGFTETEDRRDGSFGAGGYRLVFDDRNNKNWPTLGSYVSFEERFFGGEFKFHTEELDVRSYMPLFWSTSVAAGVLWKQSRGDVPFGYLAGSDGTNRFRGVDPGVWNDTQVLIYQLEFRKTLFWRLAGTIFGEWLQSGPHFGALFRDDYHYSVGFGGRLALNRSENLYARGDLSFIDGKHIGITVYLREAF